MAKEANFKPEMEKIMVKPIMRSRNPLVADPNHEAFFLFGTSSIEYSLPLDRQGNLINPFKSNAEKEWLEEELDLDLNYHKLKDNYWKSRKAKVRLTKSSRILDLTNPKDYLDYVVLRANTMYIAPNEELSLSKATYRYKLCSVDQEITNDSKDADLKIEAYVAFGKLRENKNEMINFLKVYGKKVSEASKPEFLVSQIKQIIEDDTKGFLTIWEDKDAFDMKLLISECVEIGALNKKGREYVLPGGDPLCNAGEIATIKHAVEFLSNPKNQDVLLTLKTRLDNHKK